MLEKFWREKCWKKLSLYVGNFKTTWEIFRKLSKFFTDFLSFNEILESQLPHYPLQAYGRDLGYGAEPLWEAALRSGGIDPLAPCLATALNNYMYAISVNSI